MSLTLPQCYLADLPPEAQVTPALIRDAWLSVLRNREHYLVRRATSSILRDLESAAALWRAQDSPYRRLALDLGPAQTGFSAPILEEGLSQLFGSLTVAQLEAWVEQDLGHPSRLDAFCATGPERASHRRSKAVGPSALAHITAGNIPPAGVLNVVSGLLVRSAQFVKCAAGGSWVPRLFAHSLREINPHLGACLEIAEWPRERTDLTEALIADAECVTASGSDEAISALRSAVPVTKRFVAYGHRVSFAYIAADAMGPGQIETLAARAARDVCAWNQQGCLSPHVIYVQETGAEDFARHLAAALDAAEQTHPRGPLPDADAATIRSRRSFYEVRAAASRETRLWHSNPSTAWTVVYEANPQFQASCLNRFVYVKGVDALETALQGADRLRRHVSTVGLAASPAHASELAARLADWGVTRICPLGQMQDPPPLWRHDGRPALTDLVRWTDWEEEAPSHTHP
ncbi:MAG: hypothetical protein MUE94_06755 [Verrucomicrobia bacterium]|jgi:hypothetical protein|nr:hypothetical protein [Verrucomicrobiota bacterium]